MLSMDDIKYIKRLHGCEGASIREIMRRTGYHYETVKKYLNMEDFNEPLHPPREVPSLLDPLKPIIDSWLEEDLAAPRKQRHTAKRVYKRLLQEYPEKLAVKQRTVQYYVSQKKKELFKTQNKAYLPLTHIPGEAQVDFGHFSYKNDNGEMIGALKLTMSFPYSNHAYCQIFGGENQECLLQGMKNIFEHLGKVPSRMVFDNLSAAVAHMGAGHDRIMSEGFKRFMLHYGIEVFFCNGAAGWEKGNVETKVGYERRNMFVPVPTILNFKIFNEKLWTYCENDAIRPHYAKGTSIDVLFKEDLAAMKVLNKTPFDVYSFESRIADKYAKISFDSNLYSSSPRYAKEAVYVKATSDKVIILNMEYAVVAEHARLYGKGRESLIWLPYIDLLAKRPTALKYSAFYEGLPDNWQKYLNSQDYEGKKKGLAALYFMLQKHDMRKASDVLSFALSNGVQDADSILAGYRTLTSEAQQLQPMQLQNVAARMPTFPTSNEKYDEFFRKEDQS